MSSRRDTIPPPQDHAQIKHSTPRAQPPPIFTSTPSTQARRSRSHSTSHTSNTETCEGVETATEDPCIFSSAGPHSAHSPHHTAMTTCLLAYDLQACDLHFAEQQTRALGRAYRALGRTWHALPKELRRHEWARPAIREHCVAAFTASENCEQPAVAALFGALQTAVAKGRVALEAATAAAASADEGCSEPVGHGSADAGEYGCAPDLLRAMIWQRAVQALLSEAQTSIADLRECLGAYAYLQDIASASGQVFRMPEARTRKKRFGQWKRVLPEVCFEADECRAEES